MKYLLDACVLSEACKPQPNANVMAWLNQHDGESFISILSLGEIRKGIAKHEYKAGQRNDRLNAWFDQLATAKSDYILPIDLRVLKIWGDLTGRAEAQGTPLPVIDSLIAATALTNSLTVVTRNIEDFRRCGSDIFNPWL
jgi:predicted nucleic acid-binding protein